MGRIMQLEPRALALDAALQQRGVSAQMGKARIRAMRTFQTAATTAAGWAIGRSVASPSPAAALAVP